jgi:hypothetical protein
MGISSVSRIKMFEVGSIRVDMGNPGLTMVIGRKGIMGNCGASRVWKGELLM